MLPVLVHAGSFDMPVLTTKLRPVLASILVALSAMAPNVGSAAAWADPTKILRVSLPADITGLDPAGVDDGYSNAVNGKIFDALYHWDYLERPYRYVPSVALGMPDISSDGRTWTIRLQHGIFFADDPVFAGKRRELTAADFVYSWKRVVDPHVRSPRASLLEGKFVGLDAAVARAKATGRFDYEADIAGLRAIDRYTLQFQLVEADYTFLTALDSTALRAVAREVVQKYSDASGRVMDHPVGTGPYRLKDWQRGRRLLLEANPGFRELRFPPVPATADAATKSMAAAMKDKRIPQIGVVDIEVVEESNPLLLMFSGGELDFIDIPYDLAPKVIDGTGHLLPEYARRGVELQRGMELTVTYTYFNMEDPVVGGYTPEHVALRRAICSAYNIADEIQVIRNGQGVAAAQPIPPDIAGHVQGFKGFAPYDPAVARALLDKFGYRDREGGGYRALPDGQPLALHLASFTNGVYRQYSELWQSSLNAVGIKIDFQVQKFQDTLKAAYAGQLQMASFAFNGNTADEFMQLFYGPYSGGRNLGRFRNAPFDALYLQSRQVPEDAERDKLYEKMTLLLAAYSPWCVAAFRISNTVVAPKIRGYEKNAHYLIPPWEYLDIEVGAPKPPRQ
jgi:ABC-type transport system substrate-binding protein